MHSKRLLLALLILSLVVVSPGCNSTDPVASEGSSVTVAANPRNIPEALAGLIPSTISAIVLTGSGIRQVGVEVIFTADEGCFGSEGNNCLLSGEGDAIEITLTNGDGIATVDLYTFVGTTVQAQSGNAIGEETVTIGGQQVVGNVELISLDDLSGGVPRDTIVEFRVTVTDTNGLVVPDASVVLDIDPSSAGIPAFPNGTRTDNDGRLEFEVEILDRLDIRAQVTDVFSNTITVLLQATP